MTRPCHSYGVGHERKVGNFKSVILVNFKSVLTFGAVTCG